MACRNEGCFVADVGDVGSRKAWCLAREEIDVYGGVYLYGAKVYLKYLLAFRQVGQVYIYLSVETSCSK